RLTGLVLDLVDHRVERLGGGEDGGAEVVRGERAHLGDVDVLHAARGDVAGVRPEGATVTAIDLDGDGVGRIRQVGDVDAGVPAVVVVEHQRSVERVAATDPGRAAVGEVVTIHVDLHVRQRGGGVRQRHLGLRLDAGGAGDHSVRGGDHCRADERAGVAVAGQGAADVDRRRRAARHVDGDRADSGAAGGAAAEEGDLGSRRAGARAVDVGDVDDGLPAEPAGL